MNGDVERPGAQRGTGRLGTLEGGGRGVTCLIYMHANFKEPSAGTSQAIRRLIHLLLLVNASLLSLHWRASSSHFTLPASLVCPAPHAGTLPTR